MPRGVVAAARIFDKSDVEEQTAGLGAHHSGGKLTERRVEDELAIGLVEGPHETSVRIGAGDGVQRCAQTTDPVDEDAVDKRHKIAKEISSALYSHTFTDLSRYIGRHFSNALCSFSRVRVTTEDILHAVWEENRNR